MSGETMKFFKRLFRTSCLKKRKSNRPANSSHSEVPPEQQDEERTPPPPSRPAPPVPAPQPGIQYIPDPYDESYPPWYNNSTSDQYPWSNNSTSDQYPHTTSYRPVQSNWSYDHEEVARQMLNNHFGGAPAYYHNPPLPPPGVNPSYYYSSHPSHHHAHSYGAPDYAQQLADSIFGPPVPYYYYR